MYLALKHIHVACVIVSICGFIARFAWTMTRSPTMGHRFVRMAPHVIDTLLLAAALGMLVVARLDPAQHPWLLAKIAGLLTYIVFGTLALRSAKTRCGRSAAFVAALASFAYVVAAALTKDPWPFAQ